MAIGKFFQKDKKAKNLTLGDYQSIWTKFCFLDESGNLSNPKDPFFTIGIIKCSQPYYLQSKILYERRRRNFYDEMKFNKLSKNNLEFAKFALDSFFETKNVSFASYTLDLQGNYFAGNFDGNPWQAYEDITTRLLKASVSESEILIVIADHITVPKDIRFEVNVKRRINDDLQRLAIAGVCRFDSKSNDLLQVADLLIGAVNYDLKFATGLISSGDKHKRQFLEYLRKNLGTTSFVYGFKNRDFKIFVDKDVVNRMPNTVPITSSPSQDTNLGIDPDKLPKIDGEIEKGPSS